MKSLNIIIPCLKEAENLKFLLPQIIDNMDSTNVEYQIIIVDSCIPMDESPEVCSKFQNVLYLNGSDFKSLKISSRSEKFNFSFSSLKSFK